MDPRQHSVDYIDPVAAACIVLAETVISQPTLATADPPKVACNVVIEDKRSVRNQPPFSGRGSNMGVRCHKWHDLDGGGLGYFNETETDEVASPVRNASAT